MTKNNAVILYKMLYRKMLTLRQKYGIIVSYGFTVYGGVYRGSQAMARSHFQVRTVRSHLTAFIKDEKTVYC